MFAGIDSHKDTLAVAVIDAAGRTVTVRQIANEPDGFAVLAELVTAHEVVRVGIEAPRTSAGPPRCTWSPPTRRWWRCRR